MPEERKRWTIETWIQVAGLLAAILAILVTVFFSLRSERVKELSVSVLAKRPLLTVESSSPRDGLEVKLKGAVVAAPWLVSFRVENTGGIPIEEKDIESPLRLFFQGGKPISSEVQTTSDKSISFNTSFSDDSVTVEHKLLNPGDWVGVDVLFEGEPKVPPTVLARISGVSAPRVLLPKPADSEKVRFNLLTLPVPFLYGALVLSTLLAAGLSVGGVALAYSSARTLLVPQRAQLVNSHSNRSSSDDLFTNVDVQPKTYSGRVLFAAMDGKKGFELLADDAKLLQSLREIPSGLLTSLNCDVDTAAEILRQDLRNGLKEAIARRIYLRLPNGNDKRASDRMRELDIDNLSPFEIVEHGKTLLAEFGPTIDGSLVKGDWSDVGGGITLLLFGIALFVIVSGGWKLVAG